MSAEEIRRLEEAVSSDEADDFETLLQACSQSSRPFNIDDLVPLMFTAIRKDDTAVVETLVSRGMKISHPLIKAATSAKAKNCMTLFTKYGWDINAPISRTEPPAFVYGLCDDDMALWLVDHGADLNVQTYIDLTPMSYAVRYASPQLITELLGRGVVSVQRGELLHHALNRTSDVLQVLSSLLKHGAPLNATKYEKHGASKGMYHFMELGTPLHKAVAVGNIEAVELLLAHGADATIKDNHGKTPEQYAAHGHRPDIHGLLTSRAGGNGSVGNVVEKGMALTYRIRAVMGRVLTDVITSPVFPWQPDRLHESELVIKHCMPRETRLETLEGAIQELSIHASDILHCGLIPYAKRTHGHQQRSS